MKFFIILFSVFVASYSEKIDPFAVGGADTLWGQYPSSVILDGPFEFCGGTVIDRNHIITAARCVVNEQFEVIHPNWYRVIAGDVFFSPATFRRVERNVSRIFIHSDYNAFNGENDVAILRLGEPLPLPSNTIEPARRQTRIVRVAAQCQLVAFGRATAAAAVFRPRQVALNLPHLDRDTCAGVAQIHANRLFDNQMCGQTAANLAPCAGNLGSGLYCDGFFTGILTGGVNCNATPAIFHQVRAYNRWIDEQIARNDEGSLPGSIPFRSTQGLPSRVRRN